MIFSAPSIVEAVNAILSLQSTVFTVGITSPAVVATVTSTAVTGLMEAVVVVRGVPTTVTGVRSTAIVDVTAFTETISEVSTVLAITSTGSGSAISPYNAS